MKAIWNGVTLAESDKTQVVENNHYFPPESINCEYFHLSDTRSTCPWKGKAYYFDIQTGEDKNKDAAWYYPHPKEKAASIKNYIAFWNGVEVSE